MKTLQLVETVEELVELSRPGRPLHGCVDLQRDDYVRLTKEAEKTGWRIVAMPRTHLSSELVRLTFPPAKKHR